MLLLFKQTKVIGPPPGYCLAQRLKTELQTAGTLVNLAERCGSPSILEAGSLPYVESHNRTRLRLPNSRKPEPPTLRSELTAEGLSLSVAKAHRNIQQSAGH